jgi:hypothetical protein
MKIATRHMAEKTKTLLSASETNSVCRMLNRYKLETIEVEVKVE